MPFIHLAPKRHVEPVSHQDEIEESPLTQAADALAHEIAQLVPEAVQGMTQLQAIARKTMESAFKRLGVSRSAIDARSKEWHISVVFWSADNGRDIDRIEYEGETTAVGFDRLAVKLRDAALMCYATPRHGDELPPGCTPAAFARKLNNMRPALSRRSGKANMRYRFTTAAGEAAMLQATITRNDLRQRNAAADEQLQDIADAEQLRQNAALRKGGQLGAPGGAHPTIGERPNED